MRGHRNPQSSRASLTACSKHTRTSFVVVVVVVVASHIQCISCQPEVTTLHGGQSSSWSAKQRKENKKRKSGNAGR